MSAISDPSTLLGYWFWFKFDETSGALIAEEGAAHLNGGAATLFGSPVTLAGTTAAIWANAGAITPVGDNWYRTRSGVDGHDAASALVKLALQRAVIRADTLVSGGAQLFGFVRMRLGQNPSAAEQVWDAGCNNSTDGGIGFRVDTNGKVGIRHRPGGGAAAETFYTRDALTPGQDYVISFLIDGINPLVPEIGDTPQPTVSIWLDNEHQSTKEMTLPIGASGDGANHGIVLLGLTGTATPSNRLNGAVTPSNSRIYEIFVQRVADPLNDKALRIVRDIIAGGQGMLSSEQS